MNGYRLQCERCRSFFDRDFAGQPFAYDASYPEQRGHFDESTGAMKRRSLERWLARTGIDPRGKVACEVGFGGAHCLRLVADLAERTFGVEAVEANLERARGLGVPDVYSFADKPERLSQPVDVWLLLDSFEHLPEPAAFLGWMAANSQPHARVLLVAPEADSLSERLLGRLWPHKVPDHSFHWSRRGLREVFAGHGFQPEAEFQPAKFVSGAMLASHLAHKFPSLPLPARVTQALARIRVYGNVGEMGLTFQRTGDEAPTEATR